jgi:ABC-type polysaccharide/polyol phosphate transport system ATPase subunit
LASRKASQSVGLIERMCDNLMWLDHVALRAFGPMAEVLLVFLDADGQDGEGSMDQAAKTGTEQET